MDAAKNGSTLRRPQHVNTFSKGANQLTQRAQQRRAERAQVAELEPSGESKPLSLREFIQHTVMQEMYDDINERFGTRFKSHLASRSENMDDSLGLVYVDKETGNINMQVNEETETVDDVTAQNS